LKTGVTAKALGLIKMVVFPRQWERVAQTCKLAC
jgi:hypothetical protein